MSEKDWQARAGSLTILSPSSLSSTESMASILGATSSALLVSESSALATLLPVVCRETYNTKEIWPAHANDNKAA